jgi:hypothetical protein
LDRRFVRAHGALDVYLSGVQFAGEPDHDKKGEQAAKGAREFVEYFSEKRIHFEEGLWRDIDAAVELYVKAWVGTGAYPPRMPGNWEQWATAAVHFSEHFPPIQAKIEQQFRELIGVQKAQSNGQLTTDRGLLPP